MKNNFQKRFLYKVLDILIIIESIMWDIASFIIKPVAWFRRKVAEKLSKLNK